MLEFHHIRIKTDVRSVKKAYIELQSYYSVFECFSYDAFSSRKLRYVCSCKFFRNLFALLDLPTPEDLSASIPRLGCDTAYLSIQ